MTNEEHIEQLKKLRSFHNGSYGRSINKAIEALEQEPRKDEVILTKEEYGELVSSEFDNGYAKGFREALEQEPKIPCDLCQYQGEVCMCEYCSATPINENYGMREGEI